MNIDVTMPSNIALIKYMGKIDHRLNIASNHSLSVTLERFFSTCSVHQSEEDHWINHPKTPLNPKEQERALKHAQIIKEHLGYSGCWTITCHNNFPKSAGIASSASSMAALTKGCVQFIESQSNGPKLNTQEIAALSQMGSGSSCRSFFAPIAVWQNEHIFNLDCPFDLVHFVVLFDASEKKVSSSMAHQKVSRSPLLMDRITRANSRVAILIDAFKQRDWPTIVKTSIDDSKDMHQLLESVRVKYRNHETDTFFKDLKTFLIHQPMDILTTMDAGPNIHLIVQKKQVEILNAFFKKFKHYTVL